MFSSFLFLDLPYVYASLHVISISASKFCTLDQKNSRPVCMSNVSIELVNDTSIMWLIMFQLW